MRKVILHYHLFKNAGTSVDVLLQQAFAGQWVTREFPVTYADLNARHVALWVQSEKDAVVFSSHTAFLPPPRLEDVECFPIIFFRHPIDRIASAYAFERKQGGGTFGATLARNTSLAGYIESRLAKPLDRQCRNFHAWRLEHLGVAGGCGSGYAWQDALDALPFVGLVEHFDTSVERMVEWLQPHFPSIRVERVLANRGRDHTVSLAERLASVESSLGPDLYARLLDANSDDLNIHAAVCARYGA